MIKSFLEIDKNPKLNMVRFFFVFLCLPLVAQAELSSEQEKENQIKQESAQDVKTLSKRLQDLKKDVISLNTDLKLMEEKLLFPSNTQFSVFVSFTSGQFFDLESVKLKINGRFVATHTYPKSQRSALLRGGVHKLFVTNLSEGNHEVTAFFTGIGPNNRPYKRATTLEFEKVSGSQYLELAITDNTISQEPDFQVKQW